MTSASDIPPATAGPPAASAGASPSDELFASRLRGFGPVRIAAILLIGAAHLGDQGWPGVQQATIVGLVLGTIVAATGRIWLAMIAHAVFDLTALALTYWNLESRAAHSLLR